MRVLVVEDTAVIAIALAKCLTEAGHIVLGPAARLSVARELAKATRPDLALIDVRVRDGCGIELARELRADGVPAFLLTAESWRAEIGSETAVGWLMKPYTQSDILACVRVALQMLAGEPISSPSHNLQLLTARPEAGTPPLRSARPRPHTARAPRREWLLKSGGFTRPTDY